jgi:hypothetical protein
MSTGRCSGRSGTAAASSRSNRRLGITAKYESFTKTAEPEDLAHWAAGDPTHPAIVLAMIDEAETGGCRGQHLLT